MTQTIHRINSVDDALEAYHLTAEQLAAVSSAHDESGARVGYLVASASHPGVHYQVIYNADMKALQCIAYDGPVCKASEAGINCWHKRAVKATHILARLEARKAEADRPFEEVEEQEAVEHLVRQGWPREEATRIIYAKPAPLDPRAVRAAMVRNSIASKPFQLLK
jgi:hypothetical protein